MREVECKTADEFVSSLRITHDLWGGQPSWDWGFRGQGNAAWPLLPSAFRRGTGMSYADDSIHGPLEDSEQQARHEYKLIQQFLYLADRVGLSVPGDAQHFRMPPRDAIAPRWTQDDWPQEEILDTLATAQHHGVPTRLLDITHDSLTAAFFAADDARQPAKVGDATHFGVWAIDLSLVREGVAVGYGRLVHVTAPRASNSFLHHQDGLFLLDRMATRSRELTGFQTMDQVVDEVHAFVAKTADSERRYYRPCPASPMVMIKAKVTLAMDVLDLLDREFYNRGRIMPTHDNVVKALEFQRALNGHRRKRGALPAVTFGPKY